MKIPKELDYFDLESAERLFRIIKAREKQNQTQHSIHMSETLPLDIDLDLTDVTTAMPVLSNTNARVRVADITQSERDGRPLIKFKFTVQESVPTEDGLNSHVGFPLYSNIDPAQDWMKEKLARFMDALLGTGDRNNKKGKPVRPRFNQETINRLIGTEAVARIVVQTSSKTGYVGNDIKSLAPLNGGE